MEAKDSRRGSYTWKSILKVGMSLHRVLVGELVMVSR